MAWNQAAFGKRLKALREQNGLSMLAFGKEIGTSASRIKHWEEGKSAPSASWIVAISERFGISAESLLTGEKDVQVNGEEPELPESDGDTGREPEIGELMDQIGIAASNAYAGGEGKERLIREIGERLTSLSERDLNELFLLVSLKERIR